MIFAESGTVDLVAQRGFFLCRFPKSLRNVVPDRGDEVEDFGSYH